MFLKENDYISKRKINQMITGLLPHNFKRIGFILILVSTIFFLINLFHPLEIGFLKNVNIESPLNPGFPKIEGSSSEKNLNPHFFEMILFIGLLFISICKQKNENEVVNVIRINTFIIVNKLFVIFNIISLFLVTGLWYFYLFLINMYFYLVIYNIIFYYKISKNNRN